MQRYFAKEKIDNRFILYDSDIHHIKNVMRCKINDQIEVIFNSSIYICNIKELEPLSLEIVDTINEDREMNTNLTIAISLVNEQKMDLILQKLTELGVSTIIPVKTERSIIKIDDNTKAINSEDAFLKFREIYQKNDKELNKYIDVYD